MKVVASCGVCGIWVSRLCARQGIATMLLDAARYAVVCNPAGNSRESACRVAS